MKKSLNLIALSAFSYVMLYTSGSHAAEESHNATADGHAHTILDQHIMADDKYIDAAHAEIEGLPQLDFTTYTPQLFWMVLVFALLYIVFAKKTLPDISTVIENRKNHIESNLESAEKLTAEADTVHDEYMAGLQTSQSKAAEEIQKAEAKMKDKAAKAMNDFRERSDSELQAAETRIIAAKSAAMGDMNAIATDAANVAVEKIIGSSDASKVKAIVEGMNGKAKAA